MIQSMTGFGKASQESNGNSVEIEIKSLNSRYLDLSVRLPKDFYSKELEIRELIRKRIKRGKVSVYVNFTRSADSIENFEIEENALRNIAKLLHNVKQISGIDAKIELRDLLEFQTMFLTETTGGENDEFELIKSVLDSAINQLVEMRKSEGETLKTELLKRLKNIDVSLTEIENKARNSVKEHFDILVERAKQLYENLQNSEDRLYTELALLTEKMDITEECVRLRSHIKMFESTLNNNSEAGRRLNFIVQEMNREVNTINSKTVSTEISQLGILIKEEIEKIREQIQNIE